MPRADDRAEYWAVLKRPLIRSSRAAGAKPVGRIAGSGENPIARLFDHATNPAEIDADELTLPFRHLACDEHVIDVAGIHQRHDCPGTLLTGKTLIRSIASMMMSASFPGVRVPILWSRCAALAACR